MWEAESGRLLWRRQISAVQKANEYYTLTGFAWSPDQKRLVSGSGNGTIQLWSADSGDLLWRADAHHDSVTAVIFTPDGKNIVSSGSPENSADEVKEFSALDGSFVKQLDGNSCTVIAMAFDPDGLLKLGNLDGNVSVWDLHSGKVRSRINTKCLERRSYEWETSFSTDLKLSAVRSAKQEVTVKNTVNNELVKMITADDYRIYTRFDATGTKLIVSEYGGFELVDLKDGTTKKIEGFFSPQGAIDLSHSGQVFAQASGATDRAIKVTETTNARSWFINGHPGLVKTIKYSHDGTVFAFAGNDRNIYLLDSATRKIARVLVEHMGPAEAVAFSPDDKLLVSMDENGNCKVWDRMTGALIKGVKATDNFRDIRRMEFSPDGKVLMILLEGDLQLWDTQTWTLAGYIRTAEKYESTSGQMTIGYSSVPVSDATFASDGKTLITGHYDGTVRHWNFTTGEQLAKLKVGDRIQFLASIPQQNALLVAVEAGKDLSIKEIDSENGREIKRFVGFDLAYMKALSVDQQGKHFAASFISGEVHFWNFDRPSPIRKFDGDNSGNQSIAFSPNGKNMVYGGDGQNILIYDTLTGRKLWQLLPPYKRSELETRLEKESALQRTIIGKRKAVRDKQGSIDTEKYKTKVYIRFEHFGDMSDPGNKKMMESDELNESKIKKSANDASAIWLRLYNDSPLPISIPTQNMHFVNPRCSFQFPNRKKIFGLCREREVSIWYGLIDKEGKGVPYGFDFGSSAVLFPNMSVIFPVPLAILKNGNAIDFDYSFQNIDIDNKIGDYGTMKRLKFGLMDISLTIQK